MLPLRLKLKNFLPYRSPDTIQFEGIHLACLTGHNGAGKSSLLDAITWVLWGKARAKREDDLVHLGQQEMFVELDFEQEGIIYRVLRQRARGRSGSAKLTLFSVDADNKLNTLNEPSIADTQRKINQIMRLDYETFVNSAYLQQGKADAFTLKTPAQRKQILADILGLKQWETYEERVKEQLKDIDRQLYSTQEQLEGIEKELAKEPAMQRAEAEAQQAHVEAQQALAAAEARLKQVEYAPAQMEAAKDRQHDLRRQSGARQHDLEEVNAKIGWQLERISGFEQMIAARAEIEQGYNTLQEARQADKALGDKLKQLSALRDLRGKQETALSNARTRLEGEVLALQGRIADAQRSIAQADDTALENAQVEVNALLALQLERDGLQETSIRLREERSSLEALRKNLTAQGKEQSEREKTLAKIEGAVCPLCGQPLTEDHRQQLLAELQQQVEALRAQYREANERMSQTDEQVQANQRRVQDYNEALKRLPDLNARVGELRAQADAAAEAARRMAQDSDQLVEVQAGLASENFAPEVRQQLAELDRQIAALGYDSDSHSAAQQQLEAYREYEERQTQLRIAMESLADAQIALVSEQNRKVRLENALQEDQRLLEQIEEEIKRLSVLVEEYHARNKEANAYRTREREMNNRLVALRQELQALAFQRERKQRLQERQELLRHDEAVYKELRLAFGKNGIPAMIIETAIPELEASANRLLSRMTDGRMHLKLNTQREKITGGMAETLDIEIADELGTRSYDLYSGGEAFRIDFALRVALSQLLARRAGAQLRTLFIDEGFGSQDDDGRNKLVEAITAIQSEFDLILVITHIEELRDSFPVHIVVEKTSEGSRIAVR